MGMSDKEIAANLDHVLEFAGLTNFRDTKLKNFSSGMQVRLAFATAIQKEPDILLVDEVLAVGDIDFQRKCLDIFQQYKNKKVTTLFVSHDLNSLRRFCDKTLLLYGGSIAAFGDTNDVIDNYVYGSRLEKNVATSQAVTILDEASDSTEIRPKTTERWGNKKIEIIGVKFLDKHGNENVSFTTGDPMTIRIEFNANERTDDLIFGLIIYSESGTYCYGTNTDLKKYDIGYVEGRHMIDFVISQIPMFQGKYLLTIAAHSKAQQPYDWNNKLYSFNIYNPTENLGLFDVPCTWKLVKGD
jgi:lipopolysaccharide transport system ATP-binding protein